MRKSKVTTVAGGGTSTGERPGSTEIQKTELRENGMEYFVHYLGWNEIFDEYVGPDRLLKYNEDNIIKQRKLERRHRLGRNLKPGMLVQTKPKGSHAARGRKRKADSLMGKGSVATKKKVLNIRIPLTLMRQLIDERDFITKHDKNRNFNAGNSEWNAMLL
ncbi:chromatin/chromatin-binding, or -regulatory protein [Lithospermum erythrorhizon]|uniref:Chromatin/chromatin-binding, or -regulatory protein n=1 Tax=Lithospermum erythrorhizon TaxID=34254 RepID=A0AAV3NVY2_LITER